MSLGMVTGVHPFMLNEELRNGAHVRLLTIAERISNGQQPPDQNILTEIDLLMTMTAKGELVDAQILWYISLPCLRSFNVNVVALGASGSFSLQRFLAPDQNVPELKEISIYLRHAHFVQLEVEQGVQALLNTFNSAQCMVQGGGK